MGLFSALAQASSTESSVQTNLRATRTPSSEKPWVLSLNWKPEPQFGGFYEAETKGFLKKRGLQVKIQEGGSGTPTLQLLTSKQVDAAIVSGDEIVLAQGRGNKDIIAVFDTYQTFPQGFTTRKKTPSEPKPELASLLQDSEYTLLWQSGVPYALYMAKKYPKMKIRQAPYSGGISYLQEKPKVLQQMFITSEPLLAANQNIAVHTYLIAEEGFNPYTTVLAVRKETYQKEKEKVVALVQAVREGWASYLKDPTQTNVHMGKLNPGMDAKTFTESAAAQVPLIQTQNGRPLGSMTLERWKKLADQMVQLGLVKSGLDIPGLFEQIP